VVLDPFNRTPDYDDARWTENTRVAYPIDYIPDCVIPSMGGHPKTVIFLTADAFGVLPPISLLTKEQAMYHFMSGYTSKVAGTERGIIEPEATFSACFGKPFLPLSAVVYAKMLGERLDQHNSKVYLINTGWTGGSYGVGSRIPIKDTRAMVSAALNGDLDNVKFSPHPIFKVLIPETVPNVSSEILNHESTWSDRDAYYHQANKLAQLFQKNFSRFDIHDENILKAQPQPIN
jgi:phosphoenolpyruvate carboxykinase (ATP)